MDMSKIRDDNLVHLVAPRGKAVLMVTLQKAAKSFEPTKQFVLTRARPRAPAKPPVETLAGFLAAPIDRLKDAFARFLTDEMKEKAER